MKIVTGLVAYRLKVLLEDNLINFEKFKSILSNTNNLPAAIIYK